MESDRRTERVRLSDPDTISYLERDLIRNALDIWHLQNGDKRYELYVSRVGGDVRAHLGVYRSPEANYVGLAGEPVPAEALLPLVPHKAVLIAISELRNSITRKLRCDTIYHNDIMVVKRGEERLRDPDLATRLSDKFDSEYSSFGTSFNVKNILLEWIQERLDNDIIFGAFAEGKLASVASLVAWLPEVSVIMGVETKPAFRGKGLGGIVASAVVREGLKRSQSCALFVRSDKKEAIGLYRALGFRKVGQELWIDIGTGLVP